LRDRSNEWGCGALWKMFEDFDTPRAIEPVVQCQRLARSTIENS